MRILAMYGSCFSGATAANVCPPQLLTCAEQATETYRKARALAVKRAEAHALKRVTSADPTNDTTAIRTATTAAVFNAQGNSYLLNAIRRQV